MNSSRPRGSAMTSPVAAAPTRLVARSVSMCKKSMRSKSSTRVSAASTKIAASRSAETVVMPASRLAVQIRVGH